MYSALDPFPDGAFTGSRALTTQNYTEANVKNGVQFEASTFLAALAGGAVSGYVVITGAVPVVLKGRTISVSGLGLKLEMFRAPTVSADGTKIACDKYVFGSDLQGGVSVSSATLFTEAAGLEMVLAPDTVYYFKSTSLDTDPQRVFSYNTWYEGETDLPIP